MGEMILLSIVSRKRYRTLMRFPVLRAVTPAMCLAVAGLLESCGGLAGSVKPPALPDFVLSESPTTVTIQAGGTGSQVSVSVQPVNAFSSTVPVSSSGLPVGVTATPASFNVAVGSSQSVTLAASSSAAATTATVTLTGK